MEAQTSADVVDRSVIDDLIALVETKSCSLCGKRGHLSLVCRSSGGNANAWAVEVEPAEPEEEREIQHVWALSVYDTSGLPLDALSVCDNSDLPSDESGNLLNMIMDSGAEEHVVSLADWKSLGEPVLKPAPVRLRSATGDDMGVSGSFMVRGWCDNQMVELTALVATQATRSLCSATKLVNAGYSIEMRPTQSVLRRSGSGCILLQRCRKRNFLSIRVRKSCEINAITFSTLGARSSVSRVNCVHCVLVTCLLLKSDFPGHVKRNFDTSLTVTPSMTTSVKSARSRVEFPDTHVECTLNPAHSITRLSVSKNLTVTSLC